MFDLILVPLDGSQLAECVLPYSVAVAHSFDSEITLLRMLEKDRSNSTTQVFDLLHWQIRKTEAALYLDNTKARLRELDIQTQTIVLEGLVAEGITEYAQNQGIKLIVLSSHGRSGLTQWGLSSITQKIVLSAPTSLLIVRAHQSKPQAGKLSSANPLYQRILVPLDGSQRAEIVLPIIKQLALSNQSQIHIVQVIQTPEMARQMPPTHEDSNLSSRVVARNQEEARGYLERVKSRSSLDGIEVQTHLVTSENSAVTLHQLVDQESIDLVALSAHGYSGNHRWPYGGMANNFIMYGKVPLLIVQDQPAKQDSMPVELSLREPAEH